MKQLFLSTFLIALAFQSNAETLPETSPDVPVQVTNNSANAHVGIVQSESNSSSTATGGSATAIGGGATAHGGSGGTAISGGNSSNINIEGDEAAASSAYAGAQVAADICSGTAAVGFGAQTVGAGLSWSFRGADRFCQIRAVAGDQAAIAYLASVDRHARKAFEMSGVIAPKSAATTASGSASASAATTSLYAKCELDGRTLRFAPKAGVDRDAALAECKRFARVR